MEPVQSAFDLGCSDGQIAPGWVGVPGPFAKNAPTVAQGGDKIGSPTACGDCLGSPSAGGLG